MSSAVDFLKSLSENGSGIPRILVIVAHPDDEVIGAGGILRYMRGAHIFHVTDGSPRSCADAFSAGCASREAYARVRREELLLALKYAGFGPHDCSRIGMIDQEVSYNMAGLSWRIADILKEWRPEVVLTHAFEGGHPDHDATAFSVKSACSILEKRGIAAPRIIEFASYHGNGGCEIVAGDFIPFPGHDVWRVKLSEVESDLKRGMMECFRSQRHTLAAFQVGEERFRFAPDYDFRKAPHEGVLYYEFFDWGMSSRKWLELAQEASGLLTK